MDTFLHNLPNKALLQALPEHLPHKPEGIQAETLREGLVSQSLVRRRYLPEVTVQTLSAVHQRTPDRYLGSD